MREILALAGEDRIRQSRDPQVQSALLLALDGVAWCAPGEQEKLSTVRHVLALARDERIRRSTNAEVQESLLDALDWIVRYAPEPERGQAQAIIEEVRSRLR